MKTEKEKMILGEFYMANDEQLVLDRKKVRKIIRYYNQTAENEEEKRTIILKELLGFCGENIFMEPNIRFDYGYNTFVGKNFYTNFDCVILDVCKVTIGDNCLFGPGVHVYTATHPLESKSRMEGIEFGIPVNIGNNVWVGGRSIINPGVTIGDNVVIASGSVVTKDIPNNVLVAGCPARIIKQID